MTKTKDFNIQLWTSFVKDMDFFSRNRVVLRRNWSRDLRAEQNSMVKRDMKRSSWIYIEVFICSSVIIKVNGVVNYQWRDIKDRLRKEFTNKLNMGSQFQKSWIFPWTRNVIAQKERINFHYDTLCQIISWPSSGRERIELGVRVIWKG